MNIFYNKSGQGQNFLKKSLKKFAPALASSKKFLLGKQGQGMVLEYALTFFLVIGFAAGMTVYVRRAVQARVRAAQKYVVRDVEKVIYDPNANLVGTFYRQYEPYYTQTQTVRTVGTEMNEQIFPAGQSGIYQRDTKDTTISIGVSTQAPPAKAD